MYKKKIAIICDYILIPERIGGMDRFYLLFDKKLKELNYEVDWYVTYYNKFHFYDNLTITSANGNSVEQKFIEVSKNRNYDIIVTHFTQLCTKYYKYYKSLHKNAYVLAVDHNPRPFNGFPYRKRIKKRIQGLLYSKYVHQFIGVSRYTVNHILKDYGSFLKKKTKVIYNGIDIDIFKKRTKENRNKFIVVSHLRKNKGIQDLLKALNILENVKLEGVKVDIYGDGPYKPILRQLCINYNLKDVVTFKGSSPNLHQLFSEHRYMIQPSYMECFSLSILESLSANVPVITSTVGGNLEVLTDNENSYIFSPGDIESLAKILENIISGEKKISLDTSTIVVEKFSLERMVNEHIKVLACI